MARPRAKVDPNQVEQLAAICCTTDEMAAVLCVHKRTLERRFAAAIETGRAKGRVSIRRAQYKVGVTKENPNMLVWLGKNYLGQKDKSDEEIDAMRNIQEKYNNTPQEEAVATARGKRE